jgi:hypothetical protein|tara:strand:+ start:1262 stop:1369 length:108 start_codon:yes stop_codon:yes gene_type:complete
MIELKIPDLIRAGRFVLNPVYNIRIDVSPKNISAR